MNQIKLWIWRQHPAAWRQRIAAQLLTAFGAFAVALASFGLYAVVAHSVSQRVREIGIRIAIGAQAQQVSALVVRQGMNWVIVGALVGLPAAVLTTLAMQKGIPGTLPHDPMAFGAALLLLAIIGLLARLSARPPRRAHRSADCVAPRMTIEQQR